MKVTITHNNLTTTIEGEDRIVINSVKAMFDNITNPPMTISKEINVSFKSGRKPTYITTNINTFNNWLKSMTDLEVINCLQSYFNIRFADYNSVHGIINESPQVVLDLGVDNFKTLCDIISQHSLTKFKVPNYDSIKTYYNKAERLSR